MTQQITFELPTQFDKYYFKEGEREFFKDLDTTKWLDIVDGFQKRFKNWYFVYIADGDASYVGLCALCALIEVFGYYKTGDSQMSRKTYATFLESIHPDFDKPLTPPIKYTYMGGGQQWKEGELSKHSQVFYSGVRCSLMHHGDLANYAGMMALQNGDISRIIEKAVKSSNGQECPIIIFDPSAIKVALENCLSSYCEDLRKDSNSDLATKFKDKFKIDFGIDISSAK